MSDNFAKRFKLLLTRELNNVHEGHTVAALRCVIRAAEDAEREGREEQLLACCDRPESLCECRDAAAPPATLPPLDEAIVEECARAGWGTAKTATGSFGVALRAALTHYEQSVVGPLREELATESKARSKWYQNWINQCETSDDALREADRLRAELNQYDERGHDARNEIEGLRAELAALKARPAESGERQKWAWIVRHYVSGLTGRERERIATLLEEPEREGES